MGSKSDTPKRSPNGSVSLQEYPGIRRFKYTYQGKACYLTLPKSGVLHPVIEIQIQRGIENDILNQVYDTTQQRYKDWIVNRNLTPSTVPVVALTDLFRTYLEKCGKNASADMYYATQTMLSKWKQATPQDTPKLLMEMRYASSTYNTRRSVLNQFFSWMIQEGTLRNNPFNFTPMRRKSTAKSDLRKALSDTEINDILEAIRLNTFVSSHSHRYQHSHYYPILMFMAYTGVRPAEAIGLKVSKVNFRQELVYINEALARTRKGSHSKARIWKDTKMSNSRTLPFKNNQQLKEILIQQCKYKKPGDLVFPSQNNLAINDRNLSENILNPVLRGLGIPRRVLYVFRHSFITRCVRNNMDIKTLQYLTGHRDINVLLNIYAEFSGKPPELPGLSL